MGIRKIVKALPYPLERSVRRLYGAIPPEIRYGRTFRQMYAFLQDSQWWSRERLEEYQMQHLSKLIRHAYGNVPYYRKTFDEVGVKPEDIKSPDDMGKLPFVKKEDIRDNLQDLLALDFRKRKLSYVTTSGSTGVPLGFYEVRSYSTAIEQAFICTQWGRVGYKLGDRSIVLRGSYVAVPDKNKYWRYDPVSRELILSSYHLTDENIPKYLDQLRSFRPDFIKAYPSALAVMARYIVDNEIDQLPEIKAMLIGSENLYPAQRELLERAFSARVFSWYGHSEKSVLAAECEYSNYYHIFPEYGYAEVLDANDDPVTKSGEMGEIVGTGFYNFAMPIIRYKTRDLAILAEKGCSKCGRNHQLLARIEGRLQELVVTGKGRLVSITMLIGPIHSDVFGNVKQYQFYQDTKGEVVFRAVRKPTYTDRDTRNIRRELGKRLGDDVDLIFRFVDDIPRTSSGKHKFLIQKLPINFGD